MGVCFRQFMGNIFEMNAKYIQRCFLQEKCAKVNYCYSNFLCFGFRAQPGVPFQR